LVILNSLFKISRPSSNMAEPYSPRFAVVGCVRSPFSWQAELCGPWFWSSILILTTLQVHGSLNQIYADIKVECEKRGWETVDAVILGGDTQVSFCLIASRNSILTHVG
jgi:hypothetical protein